MTATTDAASSVVPSDHISATIDDIVVSVPKGTLVIRAAEQIGIEIPRFCDHPLLEPVAACRMCLIEIEGMPKPQPACAIPLTDGMVVRTQLTSTVAAVAQRGVMEFLLINHPLDCPICDKGGECPLQNQAMTAGSGTSRFEGTKRTFPKPVNVSAQILLDRERCVSCARCTRFADEVAGDPLIELLERGAHQQVGIADDEPFDSYFSGNTIQICPVGALTSAGYRFRARPFDLVSTPTACEHCASGCAMRTDVRRSVVMRRLAGDDPEVNLEWNCDKGRFAFPYLTHERLSTPMVRDEDGRLRTASWPEALDIVSAKLAQARGTSAVLTGGRLCREDAYAYAKFARVALGTDDIDFRSRPASAEERSFLSAVVAGTGLGVTYHDLQTAPVVVLAGLEPEEESPIIFLRLRRAVMAGGPRVLAIAAWDSPGFAKASATLVPTVPGGEPEALARLADPRQSGEWAELLRQPGAVVLLGERLASVPGAFSAAVNLAADTGAQLAWVPRRAGERGALDMGAMAGLLPGGRPVGDPGARAEVASAWGVPPEVLPDTPGRGIDEIIAQLLAQAADVGDDPKDDGEVAGRIDALVVAGMQTEDFPDPTAARAALEAADFVVHLAIAESDICGFADVVLPVRSDPERAGSYTDWEGRVRPFGQVFRDAAGFTDSQVLTLLAQQMGSPIGSGDTLDVSRELTALGEWGNEERAAFTPEPPAAAVALRPGQAILSTWRHLLDEGQMQEGEPYLAATRRPVVARVSPATAAEVGVAQGDMLTVANDNGTITLPVELTQMPDRTVWIPANSPGSQVHEQLRVAAGAVVQISDGGQR